MQKFCRGSKMLSLNKLFFNKEYRNSKRSLRETKLFYIVTQNLLSLF